MILDRIKKDIQVDGHLNPQTEKEILKLIGTQIDYGYCKWIKVDGSYLTECENRYDMKENFCPNCGRVIK